MGKIIVKSFGCDKETWQEAKNKAGPISLSKVLRQLIKMWLNGQIEIDWEIEGGE